MFCPQIILISAILVHFSLVQSEPNPKLIHQVILFGYGGNPDDLCGGALVTYEWIVTSYKCVALRLSKNFIRIKVIGGFSDENGGFEEDRNVTYIRRSKGKIPDLGLVLVDKPFTKSNVLSLCKLPKPGQEICDNPYSIPMYMVDMDKPKKTGMIGKIFEIKKKVVLGIAKKILNCKIAYQVRKWTIDPLTKAMKIFGGKKEEAPCNENKGWPIFCDDVVVGIETECTSSGARSEEDKFAMAPIAQDVNCLESIITKKGKRDMESEGGETVKENKGHFFHKNSWMQFLVVLAVLVVSNTLWRERR